LTIGVALFNFYVIIQIRNSDLNNKALKYIAVILLNAPTITFDSINGLNFKLLEFQILLGMSYSHAVWAIGIPLGGMYWLWRLTFKKEKGAVTGITDAGLIKEPENPEFFEKE
jgi:hypothetical protein